MGLVRELDAAAAAGPDASAEGPDGAAALAALALMPVGILLENGATGCWINAELRRIWGWTALRDPVPGELQRALERPARPGTSIPRTPIPDGPTARTSSTWRRRFLRRTDGTTARVRVATVHVPAGRGDGSTATFVIEDGPRAPDAELRQAFLAMIGHELRTPITSIVAGAELLHGQKLDEGAQDEVAALVVEEANRVHLLVEQLTALTLLHAPSSTLVAEPIHLHHLVRTVATREGRRRPRLELRILVPDRGIAPALGDEGFVGQAVAILIDNAGKYAGTGHPVELALDDADGWVELHVLDRGPGIPGDDPDRLFNLYERALGGSGAAAGPTGSGIGLFVAREIIHAMGGRIWARRRPHGGADIGFALPAAR